MNRPNLNGFMPNQSGEIFLCADAVTSSDAIGRGMDMIKNISDSVTTTENSDKNPNISVKDTVIFTDWTSQKKRQNDFSGE